MIQLQALSYKSLFANESTPSFAELIAGVPTIKALDYIVERQNRVIYAFSDLETQRNAAYEMRLFLNEEEHKKIDDFCAANQNPVLLLNESCLLFYVGILNSPFVEDRELTNADIRNIYLAYLSRSDLWMTHQSEGFSPDYVNPEQMLLKIDLPISEFKNYKDFKASLYKGSQFFRFCETKEEYKTILQHFLEDYSMSDWRVYLQILVNAYLQTVPENRYITVNEYSAVLLDQYSLNFDDLRKGIVADINYLRSHFLIKVSKGNYLVLNNNLIIDKMYQGMKFDFASSANKHGLTINGKPVKTVGDLNQDLGQIFSEEYFLYDIMGRVYDEKSVVKYEGAYLKQEKVPAEPDYYLRIDDKVFLFEHKDVLLNDIVKQSSNVEDMLDAISDKICRDGSKQKHRKGGGQLLHSIEGIVCNGTMDKLDLDNKKATWFIPIVTVTDTGLMALGVNKVVVKMFANMAQQYSFLQNKNIHVLPLTVVDIDTLFVLSRRLHDHEVDLFDLISEYQKVICQSSYKQFEEPSFSSFIRDKYSMYEFTEKDNNFFLSSYMNELKTLKDDDLKNLFEKREI